MSLSVEERLGLFIQQYKVKNVKDSFSEKNFRIFLQGINKKIDQCLQFLSIARVAQSKFELVGTCS